MKIFSRLAIFALLGAAAAPALAAGISAGTLIESTATASYDTTGGRNTVTSNRVTIRVDEVIGATITSLDSGPVALAGASATLAFSITNTGNGPEGFRLSATPVAGSAFDPRIDGIAVDSNGNGTFDSGIDQLLQAGAATPSVAAGASLTIFVIIAAAGPANDGDQGRITLLADAATGTGTAGTVFPGQGEGGVDAIAGPGGGRATITATAVIRNAAVTITKAATISDPFGGSEPVPGSFVTFTLTTRVQGSGSVTNLVVSNPIPPGTRYIPSSLALNGTAQSDAADSDQGSAGSSGIEVRLGDVAGGVSHSITFRVQID